MAAGGINRLAGVWKEHAHSLARTYVRVMTSMQEQRGVKALMKSSPSGREMLLSFDALQVQKYQCVPENL